MDNYNEEINDNVQDDVIEYVTDAEEISASEEPKIDNSYAQSATSETYAYAVNSDDDKVANTLGIISMVCGILSLICCCGSCIEVPLAVAAIVCGIISINKSDAGKGMAIAGITCGVIGIVMGVVVVIIGQTLKLTGTVLDKIFDSVQSIDFF